MTWNCYCLQVATHHRMGSLNCFVVIVTLQAIAWFGYNSKFITQLRKTKFPVSKLTYFCFCLPYNRFLRP